MAAGRPARRPGATPGAGTGGGDRGATPGAGTGGRGQGGTDKAGAEDQLRACTQKCGGAWCLGVQATCKPAVCVWPWWTGGTAITHCLAPATQGTVETFTEITRMQGA